MASLMMGMQRWSWGVGWGYGRCQEFSFEQVKSEVPVTQKSGDIRHFTIQRTGREMAIYESILWMVLSTTRLQEGTDRSL